MLKRPEIFVSNKFSESYNIQYCSLSGWQQRIRIATWNQQVHHCIWKPVYTMSENEKPINSAIQYKQTVKPHIKKLKYINHATTTNPYPMSSRILLNLSVPSSTGGISGSRCNHPMSSAEPRTVLRARSMSLFERK